LWFAVSGLFLFLTFLITSAAKGNPKVQDDPSLWLVPLGTGVVGLAALAYGLIGAVHYVDLADKIVVAYLYWRRIVSWTDVRSIELSREVHQIKTRVPFVAIPVDYYFARINLRNGRCISLNIRESAIAAVLACAEERVNVVVSEQ
jgi:hypothetical protein